MMKTKEKKEKTLKTPNKRVEMVKTKEKNKIHWKHLTNVLTWWKRKEKKKIYWKRSQKLLISIHIGICGLWYSERHGPDYPARVSRAGWTMSRRFSATLPTSTPSTCEENVLCIGIDACFIVGPQARRGCARVPTSNFGLPWEALANRASPRSSSVALAIEWRRTIRDVAIQRHAAEDKDGVASANAFRNAKHWRFELNRAKDG